MEKQTASVTKSFTRKINLGNYESVDFFESRSHQWYDKEPSDKEVQGMSDKLYKECRESVEKHIEDYNNEDGAEAPFEK